MSADTELMQEVKNGSKAAFEQLVSRHHHGLINFFFRLAGDSQLAEDYAQEVFMKIFLHAAEYRETAKFTTYLYRIARNFWIDEVRKRNARPNLKTHGSLSSDGRGDDNTLPQPEARTSDNASPQKAVLEQEQSNILHEILETLDEDHRVTLVLSMLKGMRYAEIAAVLDIPLGTVKSRVHNALKSLRDAYSRKGLLG